MESYSNVDNLTKNRLIVCIHGLNNNPTQFKTLIDRLQKKGIGETDVFIPKVLHKGNGKLDDMVKPIMEKIGQWSQTQGGELVFVVVSNGGRIGKETEVEVAKLATRNNIKKLRVVSLVGACKGSSLATFAKRRHLSFFMSKNIAEEMPDDSERNKRLQEEWKASLKSFNIPRDYTFIASPHDLQVDYPSSLSEVEGYPSKYAIVEGHGHNSIVNAVSKAVAHIILN